MDNPQTEKQTVDAELGLFSDEGYKQSLWDLNILELREECFRQYKLSGEMLEKYRVSTTKAEYYRRQRDENARDFSRANMIARNLANALKLAIEYFVFIQVATGESVGYTRNAMEIVRRLIKDGAQKGINRANTELDAYHEAQHTSSTEYFDLPF